MLKIVQKAKMELFFSNPFYGCFLFDFPIIETRYVKTFATDSRAIFYNPEFAKSLTHDEIVGVLAHEVKHIVYLHCIRKMDREHEKWNIACDYIINDQLIKEKFTLPKGALLNKFYNDFYVEELYELIENHEKKGKGKKPCNNPGCGGEGKGCPVCDDELFDEVYSPGELPSTDSEGNPLKDENDNEIKELNDDELSEIINEKILDSYSAAKLAGKVPGDMEEIVKSLKNPKINWQEELQEFFSQYATNDYSWKRPNTRYIQGGLYLPHIESVEFGEIVVMLDSSGSVSQDELELFNSELQDIAKMSNIDEFLLMDIDTKVQNVRTVNTDDLEGELQVKGRGGTSFKPGFEYLERHGVEPEVVIYFTDGYSSDFPTEPEYPVLWILDREWDFNPPFGKVISIIKNTNVKQKGY